MPECLKHEKRSSIKMLNSDPTIFEKRKLKDLSLEARHTICLEIAKQKRQSVATSIFIPTEISRRLRLLKMSTRNEKSEIVGTIKKNKHTPNVAIKQKRMRNSSKKSKVTIKQRRMSSSTSSAITNINEQILLRHPESFPIIRPKISSEQIRLIAETIRGGSDNNIECEAVNENMNNIEHRNIETPVDMPNVNYYDQEQHNTNEKIQQTVINIESNKEYENNILTEMKDNKNDVEQNMCAEQLNQNLPDSSCLYMEINRKPIINQVSDCNNYKKHFNQDHVEQIESQDSSYGYMEINRGPVINQPPEYNATTFVNNYDVMLEPQHSFKDTDYIKTKHKSVTTPQKHKARIERELKKSHMLAVPSGGIPNECRLINCQQCAALSQQMIAPNQMWINQQQEQRSQQQLREQWQQYARQNPPTSHDATNMYHRNDHHRLEVSPMATRSQLLPSVQHTTNMSAHHPNETTFSYAPMYNECLSSCCRENFIHHEGSNNLYAPLYPYPPYLQFQYNDRILPLHNMYNFDNGLLPHPFHPMVEPSALPHPKVSPQFMQEPSKFNYLPLTHSSMYDSPMYNCIDLTLRHQPTYHDGIAPYYSDYSRYNNSNAPPFNIPTTQQPLNHFLWQDYERQNLAIAASQYPQSTT